MRGTVDTLPKLWNSYQVRVQVLPPNPVSMYHTIFKFFLKCVFAALKDWNTLPVYVGKSGRWCGVDRWCMWGRFYFVFKLCFALFCCCCWWSSLQITLVLLLFLGTFCVLGVPVHARSNVPPAGLVYVLVRFGRAWGFRSIRHPPQPS